MQPILTRNEIKEILNSIQIELNEEQESAEGLYSNYRKYKENHHNRNIFIHKTFNQ